MSNRHAESTVCVGAFGVDAHARRHAPLQFVASRQLGLTGLHHFHRARVPQEELGEPRRGSEEAHYGLRVGTLGEQRVDGARVLPCEVDQPLQRLVGVGDTLVDHREDVVGAHPGQLGELRKTRLGLAWRGKARPREARPESV